MKEFGSTEGIVGLMKLLFISFFVLFGGIVMMNLFVPILVDVYDRVKLNEEAELTRRRATIAGDVLSFVSYRGAASREEHLSTPPVASTPCTPFLVCRACFGWGAISGLMSAIASFFRSCFYKSKIRQRAGGKYFHYLVPAEKTGREKSDTREGRIRDIEKTVERELQTEFNDAALKGQMRTMQETLSRILHKIDQGQT